ncbi:MAG: hypothetical protein ABMA00_10595 [Gemmatimonas sp.]
MTAASPAPPSQPPTPPPSRRVLDAHEKVIIGSAVVGLLLTAVAVLTLPAPDASESRVAPMVTVVQTPVLAPRVDSTPTMSSPTTAKADSNTTLAVSKSKPPVAKVPAVKPPAVKPKPIPVKVVTKPVAEKPANARRRGSLCEEHVTAQAWNDAFEACTAEASSGKPLAQRRLALMYLAGSGTGRSDQQATKWFTDAANNGDVESMYQFALSLERGRGIKKDQSAALRWYTRAGDGGHAAAQYALGQAYERGRLSAPKDKRQALDWYRKAEAQNYGDAATKVRELSR